MSDIKWGISHIETIEQLPDKLTQGRAYFIDNEGYIVIDYGRGPVIYGSRVNIISQDGAPSEQLQDQIDYLTDAVFNILTEIARMTKSYDSAINILAQTVAKLYPAEHSAEWSEVTEITTGEILTTSNGEQYTIAEAYVEDGQIILAVELEEEIADYVVQTLKTGDTVEFNNSNWNVTNATTENGQVIIELELP